MVLYKQVNGERIQLSEKEEAKVRAEWAKNDLVQEKKDALSTLLDQMPSIQERLDAIESYLYMTMQSAPVYDVDRETITKCAMLQPRIKEAERALKAEEAKNG